MALSGRRAQMLLIGAITLAVLFVSLSVVLNGTIHTTTTSGQASAETSPGNLVAVQDALRRDVSGILHDAIQVHAGDAAAQETYIESRVTGSPASLESQYSDYYASNGTIVGFATVSPTAGVKVEYDSGPNPFRPDTGSDTEISPGTELRRFDLTIDQWDDDEPGNFRIVVDPQGFDPDGTAPDPDDDWVIDIYEDPTNGPTVEVLHGGTSQGTCTGWATGATIEVTNATIGGEPCAPLHFFDDLETPYGVRFENGGEAEGSYSFIASDPGAQGHGGTENAITYSVEVDLVYRSPQVHYQGLVEIAPGEP